MAVRQFIVEVLNAQGELVQSILVDRIQLTGSSVTGSPPLPTPSSFSIVDGNNQTSVVSTAVGVLPSVRVTDGNGQPVSAVSVSFIQSVNSGVVTGAQQTTNASGIATVTSWSLGTQVGTQRMEVKAGSLSTQTFSATAIAGSAFSISASGGTSQTTHADGVLPSLLTVLVQDNWSNPVASVAVTLTSTDIEGSFSTTNLTTGAAGTSGFTYQVGTQVSASVASVYAAISSATSARFAATSTVSVAGLIQIVEGDGQVGGISTALPTNPSVLITDAFGNELTGSQVTWVAGAGSLSTARTPTSSTGTAATVWTLGSSAGTQLLTARGDFLSGSTVTFTVSATSPAASQMVLFAGNSQSGLVGAALTSRLTVRFTTDSGASAVGVNATWASSDGTLGASQVVSDSDGYAGVTFSLGTTARSSVITATSSGVTGSPVTFAVSALTNQASSLTYAAQPSSNVADGVVFPQQPQAQIIDLYGNSCLSSGINVSIQTKTATGALALSGTTTVATGATGRAVFTNLKATGAGQGFTLEVTSSGLTAKTSNTVNVAAPVGSKLAFTVQPSNVAANVAFSPTVVVAVQDSVGGTVAGATDPIQLTISGAGVLTGTTLHSAVNGLATFSGLGASATGTFTITATSGTLTQAVSASFTVSAAVSNEPAGFTQVKEHDFTGAGEPNWGLTYASGGSINNLTYVTDTRFTRLTTMTGKGRLPAGFTRNGSAPFGTACGPFLSQGFTELYVDYDFAIDAQWFGHGSGVNKTIWLCANNSGSVPGTISFTAIDNAPMILQARLQGMPPAGNQPVYSFGAVNRGQKYRIEFYAKMNTCQGDGTANQDGILTCWVDGLLRASYTTVRYRGNGGAMPATAKWGLVKWEPTYGGTGGGHDAPAFDTFQYCGYLYVSGHV